MKQFKLVSLSDRIDQINTLKFKEGTYNEGGIKFSLVTNYNDFLNQKREPWMFVPMDDEGNVLEEPIKPDVRCLRGNGTCQCGEEDVLDCKEYKADYKKQLEAFQKAKERVLFKGFIDHERDDRYDYIHWVVNSDPYKNLRLDTIETLGQMVEASRKQQNEIYLTPTALKQIGEQV